MKNKLLFLLALCMCACVLSSCSKTTQDNGKIKVVASLFPQYDFARQIAGDKADVDLLLPLGTDSHSFDPSMQDVLKIRQADVFIYTGDAMEPWAASFADTSDSECEVVDVSLCVEPIFPDGHEDHDEEKSDVHNLSADPHIWTSPKNAVLITVRILTALSEADPDNADYYQSNATAYLGQLYKLDDDIKACVDASDKNKLYFGGKFSFLYFTEHYGLEYMSLYDSCSESAEPGAKQLTEMVDEMKKNEADVIFYPELSDYKAARGIAERTGAKPLLLHSCHNLSKDDFDAGKTYLSIMYENLENIKEALS